MTLSNFRQWLVLNSLNKMAFLGLSIIVSGCAHLDKTVKSDKILKKDNSYSIEETLLNNNVVRGPRVVQGSQVSDNESLQEADVNSDAGRVPWIANREQDASQDADATAPRLKVERVEAYVAPLPLPQFIDAVFGEMLGATYVMGKNVADRNEVVTLRSSGAMKSDAFLDLVSVALLEYGVRVSPEDGVYRVVEDKVLRAKLPRFIKSRARVSTPTSLRPIIQFVELQALDSANVVGILRKAFGNDKERFSIEADRRNNYAVLSGLPEDVDQAVQIIRELDELNYAGAQVRRYTPKYWEVTEISEALALALRTEGWQVATDINLSRTINLMPVAYSNDLFIFAKSEASHRRIDRWLKELDRPVQGGDTEQIFIYQVRNVDAAILAETANAVLSSRSASLPTSLQGATNVGPTTELQVGPSQASGGFFSVDLIGNRLLFSGTANEYEKLINLLNQLDTPAPEVLIEVKIAEVTLTDESTFGVEFFIDDIGGENVTAQTGGLGLGSNGTSSIQVGQDIPIITSQRPANNQTGTGPIDILQGIEYRKTGVLMEIEPIVFSDSRIDLTITQEVSSTLATANSSSVSPTISNRSISTQLSLEDGQTAVMGGLIQDDIVRDDTGVPILKAGARG